MACPGTIRTEDLLRMWERLKNLPPPGVFYIDRPAQDLSNVELPGVEPVAVVCDVIGGQTMTVPRDNAGWYILDSLPRNEHGNIDIDVYYHDTATGERRVEPSPFGNVERGECVVGPDYRREEHDVFNPYWWDEGNMGCDCNRGGYECSSRGANVVVIEKITPRGMPDVVLYSDATR